MTKKIDIYKGSLGSLGTAATWYKTTSVELMNNTGQTDVRVDKEMCQVSYYTDFTASATVACVIHLTDETGADFTAAVSNGVTDDAALEVLLNQWKDCVFMTDFRQIGTGAVGPLPVVNLEADTRRILKPGQKLYASVLVRPHGTESTKNFIYFVDNICWYSAAAN